MVGRASRARSRPRAQLSAVSPASGSGSGTRRARYLAPLLAILACLGLAQWQAAALVVRPLELATLDWRYRLRGPLEPGPETVQVVIDDRTVTRLGQWPVPRTAIAEGIRRIAASGARVIAIDLLFSESTTALVPEARQAMATALAELPAASDAAKALGSALEHADPDADLAAAIASAGDVALAYAFVFEAANGNAVGTPATLRQSALPVFTQPRGTALPAAPPAAGLLMPAGPLAPASQSLGHVTVLTEIDGSLRYGLPVFAYEDKLFPSLPVEAVRLWSGTPRGGTQVVLGEGLRIGDHEVPTDDGTRHWVNHYGPEGTIRRVSLIDLLDGKVDPAGLRDRIVLLGATVTAAGDRFATPFDGSLPGVEHHATAIDNILHGRSLIRNRATGLADVLAIVGLAVLAAALAGRRSLSWSIGVSLGLVVAWMAVASWAFMAANIWLGIVLPSLACLLSAALVEAARINAEQRRRRRLERQRANLGRYFAPTVVDRLADSETSLERTQPAAVMFVDIVGFTRLSEPMSPQAAMAMLREFHTRVERAVFAHGGMVDKFMGDGALACFGVPDAHPAAAADAVRSARDLLRDLEAWATERGRVGEPPIRAGIGIHFGPVLMGDIGGARQFQFTVIGDTVNVASRLEAMTRQQETDLIVSDDVVQSARQVLGADDEDLLVGLIPLSEVPVRGRAGKIGAWKLQRAAA
ncbi:MAG: adenylate/guanylate cyclase domain-containing protein [Geminicoccaceae bacterium]